MKFMEDAICPYCGKRFVKLNYRQKTCGSYECGKKYRYDKERLRRANLKEKGLCIFCGKQSARHGFLCVDCWERSKRKEQKRAQKLKAQNICIQCGQAIADNGTMCLTCAKKFRANVKKSIAKCGTKRKTITCCVCGQVKEHHARGMCLNCYKKYMYHLKTKPSK
jgi:hypothetical protein